MDKYFTLEIFMSINSALTLDGFKDMFENVRLAPSAVNKQLGE